ncbi:glycosyltransferase family 4 protein [Azotobacter beijerinckii]|uniref:Glycosyltransferase involved in cell wall bisynthesis n=1 Tax=Azotobacter beijerinckii TaxID=170623 RepID=A0A1I4BL88_9GAMM|nr:glycosyltransferase family 4 protein [Azotobacter beijerinckii]SFB10870.1 Glycosyltransferase involved in cell wall bisynthesis [Azotobacter beijerinckii]SFK69495.1 Glycosyltransferase involved in cell wall bisynthesis [Azotobacter beijerinckii]
MKILLLTRYPRSGASSRLRTLQYLPHLQAAGHEIRVQSLFDEAYLESLYQSGRRSPLRTAALYLRRLAALAKAGEHDLLWIEKELFPYLPAWIESRLGTPWVVDYDDALFHNYDLAQNPLVRRLMGGKIDTVMRNAGAVIVGNRYLAERARAAGAARVTIIPTVVEHSRYQPRVATPAAHPVIGWIGSPSTQKYLTDIREALQQACRRHGARLLLVGATPEILPGLPGIEVQLEPWSEDREAALIRQMDVGIMPLRDGPWECGKCGYKLIQYMACGVPLVASPTGANREIVEDSGAGLLAGSGGEWSDALSRLLTSASERERLGRAGRQAVENRYCLQRQLPVLLETLAAALPAAGKALAH